ncbi:MAG: hypothetical protein JWO36_2045, partial [Myxococcales bacterium]|nr:hypothetical protein [Myxococcales bacterium]
HGARGSDRNEDADELVTRLAATRSPGWLSQDGVKARRIAGHVLIDGAPANGAVVRLTSELSLAGLVAPREQQTTSDGHFDFGVQVATLYAIGAVVPGRVATVKRVDLRDPQSRSEDVVLGLDPCAVGFFGKVIDAAGTPIVHAELLAQDVIGAETDRSGSFDLCLRAQGMPEDLRLVIRANGYGAVELVATLSGRVHHDFVLSPEGVVSGRAITAQGLPVANAEIRFDWDEATPRPGSEQPAPVRAVTGSDGRFRAAGVAAGRRRVLAFGRELSASPFTVVVGAGESKDLEVTMTARAVVRGRVVVDGKPVAGVTVTDRGEKPTYQARDATTVPATEAVSQADGTFVLDGVATGDVSFTTTPYRLRAPKSVHVAPGEQNVTLEVEALGEIAGTVRRHGKPVPHTRVKATAPQGWVQTSTTETDESGRFVLRGLDPGDYVLFADNATVGAFVPEGARVRLGLGERREADIDLIYGARITGSVYDAKSAPVPGVLVRFMHADTDDQGRCITDLAGRFDCGSMTGGAKYRVEVSAGEASPLPFSFVGPPPAPVLLADGDAQVDGVRLVVEVQKLAIAGVVVDSSEAPIADARVLAVAGFNEWSPAPTTITTTTGRFEIGDLSAGAYSLQVIGPDSSKALTGSIQAGRKDVRVVLDPPSCNSNIDPKVGSVLHSEPTTIASRSQARVVWDDRIELIGWDIPQRVRLGDELDITLFYRVLHPIGRSWKMFIHVDGPTMRVNADHDPIGGRCPTSTWQQGDVLVDHFTIRIDPSNGAGKYEVWTGFFTGWAPTWKNMPVTQAPAEMRDSHERIRVTAIAAE